MMSQNSSVLSSMSLDNKNNKYIYSDEQLMLLFQGGNETYLIPLTGVTPVPAWPVAEETTGSPIDAVVSP